MDHIQYYVVVDKTIKINDKDEAKIDKVKIQDKDTRLPFSNNYIDLYLISHSKKECLEYIEDLDQDVQKYFNIKQIGSEIQYTAFVDIFDIM